jgi:hypothetical protein
MKTWDVFISHASEDGQSVAAPLADALRAAGLTVWLDHTELVLGDSLREKIDEGLARSRFGVVILSKSFLAKEWPRKELNGLVGLEADGRKVILPVLHGIDNGLLMQHSPLLSDRVAASTEQGLDAVAMAIVRAVLQPGSGSPSEASPGLAIRLSRLLEGAPDRTAITTFLAAHQVILDRAGASHPRALLVWRDSLTPHSSLDGLMPDLCVGNLWPTSRRRVWDAFLFEQATEPLFEPSGESSQELKEAVSRLSAFRTWVTRDLAAARQLFPDIAPNFFGTIVASRRSINAIDAARLASFNDSLIGARVRTYDWLIEAASELGGSSRTAP